MNGDDSIRHLVESGAIQYHPVPSFQAYQAVIQKLLPVLTPQDTVLLDTIGSLATSVRWDAKLGTDMTQDLWEKRGLYLGGDKNYLTVYTLAGDLTMRRLKNIRSTGARIITTSHEAEKIDPTDGLNKLAPKMNDALYTSIMAATSDVFRLSELVDPILFPDGHPQAGEVRIPIGTRILQLRKTDEAVAKYHVSPERSASIKRLLQMPPTGGLHVLYAHLGKKPTWMHLYGAPGAGKTALSCSEAEAVPIAAT